MCKLFDLKLISTAVRGLIPDLLYDKLVWPTSIRIYEVFNPGAVVRILACDSSPEELRGSVDYARYNEPAFASANYNHDSFLYFEGGLFCGKESLKLDFRLEHANLVQN